MVGIPRNVNTKPFLLSCKNTSESVTQNVANVQVTFCC